jgi:hypothetical protein
LKGLVSDPYQLEALVVLDVRFVSSQTVMVDLDKKGDMGY